MTTGAKAVIASALAIGCTRQPSPKVMPLGLIARDDGSALVHWQLGDRQPWLGRFSATALEWSTPLRGRVQNISPDEGLLVQDDMVVLRVVQDSMPAYVAMDAYDVRDGHPHWHTPLVRLPEGKRVVSFERATLSMYVSSVVTADRIGAVLATPTGSNWVNIDARSGSIVNTLALDFTPMAPIEVSAQPIVFRGSHGAAVLTESRPEHLDIDGIGCGDGRNMFGARRAEDGWRLVHWTGGTRSERAFTENPARTATVESCALFRDTLSGDTVVFTIHDSSARQSELWIVKIDGVVTGRIPLRGTIRPLNDVHLSFPVASQFGSNVTRFVPYVVSDRDRIVFTLVDLQKRAIAWSSELPALLLTTFQHDGRWYVSLLDATRLELAVIDGHNGAVLGEAELEHQGGIEELRPQYVNGGHVWLVSRAWSPLNDPGLARLDSTSLVPTVLRGGFQIRANRGWLRHHAIEATNTKKPK
ncbi:MAG TPA: hypothetical protein VFQ53_37520 [Kofleriaceae bacterium]|nr:hypothetical protein [Kofleriaceae bacterium]